MKKILLIFVLIFSLLFAVSCGEEAPEDKSLISVVADANSAIEDGAYSMEVDYSFDCENATLKEVLSSMESGMKITVDGENFAASVNMPDPISGEPITVTTVLVGDKMYVNTNGEKMVIKVDADQREEYLEDAMSDGLDIVDLLDSVEAPTMSYADGVYTISFSAFKDGEDASELFPALEELGALAKDFSLTNINGKITVADGKYDSLEFSFEMNLMGEKITCAMQAKINCDAPAVTAPADAASYPELTATPYN